MDSILEQLDAFLADESKASSEYENILTDIASSDLTDAEKTYMSGIFDKIRTDELSHFKLLKMMKQVLTVSSMSKSYDNSIAKEYVAKIFELLNK